MHQLIETLLLLQNSSDSKRMFKRGSHSFDNLNTGGSATYAGEQKNDVAIAEAILKFLISYLF